MIGQGLFTIEDNIVQLSFNMENRGLGVLEHQKLKFTLVLTYYDKITVMLD